MPLDGVFINFDFFPSKQPLILADNQTLYYTKKMNIVICVNPAKSIEEKQFNFPLAQFVFAEIWHNYLIVH